MRLVHLLISVLVGTFSLSAQQQAPPVSRPVIESPSVVEDRYSVSTVHAALQFVQRGGNTIEAKQYIWPLTALGDRVSVAALKIYTLDELVLSENTRAYLVVVRNAFYSRSSVLEKSDADPKITLFVLQFLKERNAANPYVEKTIEYLQGCVKDFACKPLAAY